ncbi:uncharacterized protein LOC103517373 isoform X2 [Diaphorina citri]|uniref:Uncharacterized protein LOC103517373 isoform X1 n=1 Tax=Diaphorina citri TaxID=121845 RepID=A0A1S3DF03_DIACI|nr:uncharacterized protein LOC103517373 isoform X1 [Diaphorina citri]XP_008480625.1 uncharacterized protein LOC103517373 isoform X2 [Diaphorina citri]
MKTATSYLNKMKTATSFLTKTKTQSSYLGKVVNALGIQAARNRKFKVKRGLVGVSQLAAGLKALRSKAEADQFKESVNYLLSKGLVKLVLPEFVKKSFQEVGLGKTQLCCCNPCCDPCCRPRLSVGVVYGDDGLPVNQGCGGSCYGSCAPLWGPVPRVAAAEVTAVVIVGRG